MQIPALSALLLAGSVSLVTAAPADKESTERVSYTETKPARVPQTKVGWIELASPTPARHGREFIAVELGRRFTRLRIDASAGRPIVCSVRIHYSDGTSTRVWVDKVLDPKRKVSAVVDLHGAHEIDQVIVNTDRDSKGSYVVQGELENIVVATN